MQPEQPKNASRYTKAKMKAQAVGLQRRALTVAEFCATFNLSRSRTYVEIEAGRLPIRKVGRAVLIAVEDAERWWASFASPAA